MDIQEAARRVEFKSENPATILRDLIGTENLSKAGAENLDLWESLLDQPGEVLSGVIPKEEK